MTPRKGFLLVTMEPPPAIEEEFNDWYDTEHVPERLAVPGFETATRLVCTSGWPRYCAFYDLSTPEVIDSPAYRAISGDRFSPWTRRILARARGFYRVFGEQVYRAGALSGPVTRVLLIRFRGAGVPDDECVIRVCRAFEKRPDVRSVRVLRSAEGVSGGDILGFMEFSGPAHFGTAELDALGALSTKADLINEYAPMVRTGSRPKAEA